MKPITNPTSDTPAPSLDQLARTLLAPERWRILAELAKGEALPVNELGRRIGTSAGNLSRHMRILRESSLVKIGYGKLYSLAPTVRLDAEHRLLDLGLCLLKLDALA